MGRNAQVSAGQEVVSKRQVMQFMKYLHTYEVQKYWVEETCLAPAGNPAALVRQSQVECHCTSLPGPSDGSCESQVSRQLHGRMHASPAFLFAIPCLVANATALYKYTYLCLMMYEYKGHTCRQWGCAACV